MIPVLRATLTAAALAVAANSFAQLPTPPRATSGDTTVQPAWSETLTVTVGPLPGADIGGTSEKALQAAVDAVARVGGGTVRVQAGTFRLRNSVFLASNVRLVGEGEKTVLVKEASVSTPLAEDSDWYDQEITLANADGFRLGDGVCLRAGSARFAIKRTLVARSGARFRLDRPLRDNVWISSDEKATARVSTLFPLLSGENVHDVTVENLVLDGNRAQNGLLDGNYAGCAWFQDCSRLTLRGLTARNYHGDGLSWQICHDVLVERCASTGHSGCGLHPGSGSQRSVIRHCRLEGNDTGLFFCWGVRAALAEKNVIAGNRVGLSLGHRDTDNLIRGNEFVANHGAGLVFRQEKDAAAAAHRCVVEGNTFTDNGGEAGPAIHLAAPARGVILRGNRITTSRSPGGAPAILVEAGVPPPVLEGNSVSGYAAPSAP